jgi:hypothetical protein
MGSNVNELVHGKFHRLGDFSSNENSVVLPSEARAGSVVSHVVETGRSDESCFSELTHGGLDIERVATSQSNQAAITRNPFIWSLHITMIGVFLQISV